MKKVDIYSSTCASMKQEHLGFMTILHQPKIIFFFMFLFPFSEIVLAVHHVFVVACTVITSYLGPIVD